MGVAYSSLLSETSRPGFQRRWHLLTPCPNRGCQCGSVPTSPCASSPVASTQTPGQTGIPGGEGGEGKGEEGGEGGERTQGEER